MGRVGRAGELVLGRIDCNPSPYTARQHGHCRPTARECNFPGIYHNGYQTGRAVALWVVVITAAFHARVRGLFPGLGGLKEANMFLPHPLVK